MKNTIRTSLLSFALLLPAFLRAEERSSILLALQAGGGTVFSPSGFSSLHHEPIVVGGRLGYQISDRWAVGGQFSNYHIGSSTTPSQDVTLQPITAWVQRDFTGTRLWTPYLLASAGVSRNARDHFSTQESDTGWTAGLAFGLNLRVSEMNDLSFEIGPPLLPGDRRERFPRPDGRRPDPPVLYSGKLGAREI